jgi:putative ABC transport system substrate-binding protein
MQRRQFITLLAGSVAAWPLRVHAQQTDRMRRIGVLMNNNAEDLHGQRRLAAFLQRLQQLGWTDGRNVRIDIRWGVGSDSESGRRYAAELVALAPDVILTATTLPTVALQRATAALKLTECCMLQPHQSPICTVRFVVWAVQFIAAIAVLLPWPVQAQDR